MYVGGQVLAGHIIAVIHIAQIVSPSMPASSLDWGYSGTVRIKVRPWIQFNCILQDLFLPCCHAYHQDRRSLSTHQRDSCTPRLPLIRERSQIGSSSKQKCQSQPRKRASTVERERRSNPSPSSLLPLSQHCRPGFPLPWGTEPLLQWLCQRRDHDY